VLRKIFGLKKYELSGHFNQKVRDLYKPPNERIRMDEENTRETVRELRLKLGIRVTAITNETEAIIRDKLVIHN
jgi:hypothetical protein